jgi:hypothetical protein
MLSNQNRRAGGIYPQKRPAVNVFFAGGYEIRPYGLGNVFDDLA